MSVEEQVSAYLRCDAEAADWSRDGRCAVTFGRRDSWPATYDAVDAMARQATGVGWRVEVERVGIVVRANALCPDHAEAKP